MQPDSVSRRSFLGTAAALTVGGSQGSLQALTRSERHDRSSIAATSREPWAPYDDAIVIDFLASPGYFNYPLNPPLDAEMIRNAVESGITAVNLTCNGSDFTSSVQRIAGWIDRIEQHPESFRQVRTVADLHDAKATGRASCCSDQARAVRSTM